VIYVHGIGAHRRNEEISRFIDGLDRYSYDSSDTLRRQELRREPRRFGDGDDVEYVSSEWLHTDPYGDKKANGNIRIYEAYWSHAVAGGYSATKVMLWLIWCLISLPIKSLIDWRKYPRFKRALLSELFYSSKSKQEKADAKHLSVLYRQFEEWGPRRRFPSGSFRAFIKYIGWFDRGYIHGSTNGDFRKFLVAILRETKVFGYIRKKFYLPELMKYLAYRMFLLLKQEPVPGIIPLAKKWRRLFILRQIFLFFMSLTILGGLIDAIAIVYIALSEFFELPLLHGNSRPLTTSEYFFLVFFSAMLLLVGFYARRFLSFYVADIMFWVNSDEKSSLFERKRRILRECESTFRHVLADENCSRIVIVAHSLGSAIAYETLLELGRKVEARSPEELDQSLSRLSVINAFITLGSPIEYLSRLFEAKPSLYHRYNRILGDRAGSTDSKPFNKGKGIHWINVTNPADLVSSKIFAPIGEFSELRPVYEWQTASNHVSGPLDAHSGYFYSSNALNLLFHTCVTKTSASRKNWNSMSAVSRFLRGYSSKIAWLIVVSVVWLIALFITGYFIADSELMNQALLLSTTLASVLAGLIGIGIFADKVWKLKS
jgi:hypothetical protein